MSTYSTMARGRHGHGYLRGPGAIIPGFDGAPPGQCQYIAGEPSADDSCKCLAPAVPGRPYCGPHAALCYIVYQPKPKAEAA